MKTPTKRKRYRKLRHQKAESEIRLEHIKDDMRVAESSIATAFDKIYDHLAGIKEDVRWLARLGREKKALMRRGK